MKRFNWLLIGLIVLCLATVPLAGCTGVSQSEYEALQADYDELNTNYAAVEAELAEYEALMEEDTSSDWLIKRKFTQHDERVASGDTFDCDLKFINNNATQPVRIRGWIVGISLGQIWQGTQLGYVGGCTEVTRATTARTNYALDRCFTYWNTVGNAAQNEVTGATGVGVNRMKEFYDRQTCDDLGLMLNPGETIEVHSNIHNCIGATTSVTVFVIWFYEEV